MIKAYICSHDPSASMCSSTQICKDDETKIEIDLAQQGDNIRSQPTWELSNACSGEIIALGAFNNDWPKQFISCVPRGQYRFNLEWSGVYYPNDFVSVNYDGGEKEVQVEGEDIGSFTSAEFGIGCPPTMAPTEMVCDDNETSFEVDIIFDSYSDEISWELFTCTGMLVFDQSYAYNEETASYAACVPRGNYLFVLSDSYGDGLSDPGSVVTVNYDGGEAELYLYGNFGSSTSGTFGDGDGVACTFAPTMAPTLAPTIAPTLAPTLVCDDNETSFEVDIIFDSHSDEISWELFTCTGMLVVLDQSYYAYNEETASYAACVPRGNYIFVLSDSYGDGLSDPGSVTVNYDGGEAELYLNGNFGSSTGGTFGDGDGVACTSAPPTMAPTPTKSPKAPTKSHKAPPTKSPKAPIKSPKAPTKSPKAPTKSPKAPTKSPKAPTKSPKAPTKSPKAPSNKAPVPLPVPPTSANGAGSLEVTTSAIIVSVISAIVWFAV